jgi:hypothetical protein
MGLAIEYWIFMMVPAVYVTFFPRMEKRTFFSFSYFLLQQVRG